MLPVRPKRVAFLARSEKRKQEYQTLLLKAPIPPKRLRPHPRRFPESPRSDVTSLVPAAADQNIKDAASRNPNKKKIKDKLKPVLPLRLSLLAMTVGNFLTGPSVCETRSQASPRAVRISHRRGANPGRRAKFFLFLQKQ